MELQQKRAAIERELPQLASTIRQQLGTTHDVVAILTAYRRVCGPVLSGEIDKTLNDMMTGNAERALRSLETRVGSARLGQLTRGLIAVMHGEEQRLYFDVLADEFTKAEDEAIERELLQRPQKLNPYMAMMFGGLVLMIAASIGTNIMCATWIFFTCLYDAYKIFNLRFILILTIPFVLLTWFYSACVALHSCARLLAFWLVHGFFFAITIVAVEETISKSSAQSVTAYCLFVLAFSSLWIMEAGAADDDVVKMAALIINTATTILLIVINVLSGWGLNELSQFPKLVKLLARLQYYSVVILLPLVVAGYLSALLKEAQIYWKNHVPHES